MIGLSQRSVLHVPCLLLAMWMLVPIATMTGCGGGNNDEVAEEDVEEERPRRRKSSRSRTEKSSSRSLVAQTQDGLKGVPFDVWPEVYAAPKVVLPDVATPPEVKTGMTTPTPEPGKTPATTVTPKPDPIPTPKAPVTAAGSVNWSDLISGEELDGEAKTLRNILTSSTGTMGAYRRARKDIASAGATLALVAVIANQHPDNIRWKTKAAFVRGYGTAIAAAASKEASRMEWENTQIAVEAFGTIMSGSTPSDAPPDELPLDETVDFAAVMRRMQAVFDSIRNDSGSADDFKANKDELKQRSAMLTAMFQAITHKDFALAEEPEYITAAQAIISAGKEMRNTFATDNFDGFSEAFGRINGSCSNCHQKFKE